MNEPAPAPIPAHAMSNPLSRVDGHLKVTGAAKYPYEFPLPDPAQAFLIMSTISKGRIAKIDSAIAEKAPCVLAVITHANALKLAEPPNGQIAAGIRIEQCIPLSHARISCGGQYVAASVADTFENVRHAASFLKISYAAEKPRLHKEDAIKADKPKELFGEQLQVKKGDGAAAFGNTEFVKIEQTYSTPTETHNPMECSATISVWDAPDRLAIYDATIKIEHLLTSSVLS